MLRLLYTQPHLLLPLHFILELNVASVTCLIKFLKIEILHIGLGKVIVIALS